MKYLGTILSILLCFISVEILAQRIPVSYRKANLETRASLSGIYQKGSHIWLDGNKLSREELSAMEGFDIRLYTGGRVKTGIGTALISIGALPCALGMTGFIGCVQESIEINRMRKKGIEPHPSSGLSAVVMFLGLVPGFLFEAAGIPLHCSGKADIRRSAVDYNRQKSPQYSFGPATSGLGIAMYF